MKGRIKPENGIVDIARELGISAATVSRALNNHPRISQATKERVKIKAEEMGYLPNRMASSLRNKKSNVIGLIVPKISMYFHSVFIAALQNILHSAGYTIIICQSDDSVDIEKESVNTLFSSRVDALVVSLSMFTEDYSPFLRFINAGIPVLFYDRVPIEKFPAYIFKGDDFNGGFLAGQHLAEIGCKKPAYITGLLNSNLYIDRTAGFKSAVNKYGLELKKEWMFFQELNKENARTALIALFSTDDFPDAIFACNDITAMEVVKFARERSIRIPEDLKVIGYSNDPLTSIITPGITTVEQFPEEMAQKVADRLMSLMNQEAVDTAEIADVLTPVSLVVRQSTIQS